MAEDRVEIISRNFARRCMVSFSARKYTVSYCKRTAQKRKK